MNTKPLILIGDDARSSFDTEGNPMKTSTFKYILIKSISDDVFKILLFVVKKPNMQLHAQALYQYMIENSLPEITVHGGGRLDFVVKPGRIDAILHGKSYAFKSVYTQEVYNIVKMIWPYIDLIVEDIVPLAMKDRHYHRIYSIAEILAEANKPIN